jgi:hypothetical protein
MHDRPDPDPKEIARVTKAVHKYLTKGVKDDRVLGFALADLVAWYFAMYPANERDRLQKTWLGLVAQSLVQRGAVTIPDNLKQ